VSAAVSAVPPETPAETPLTSATPRTGPTPVPSNTGRKFPCPGCGAKLDFDPGNRALKCPFCGYAEQIDPTAEGVRERDWDDYWRNAGRHGATIVGRSSEVQCKACAAVVLLEDKVVTDKCPYCGNDLENKPVSAEQMILPEGILPFKIDLKRARGAFKQWIDARWFAPSDLRRMADLGQLNGVYVPFWTFDSMTYTHYTGERGDNYQELETYVDHETYTETDGQGNTVTRTRPVTKTRTVTKIRWWPASGDVDHFFDDVLVCASHSLPADLVQDLGPWDLQNYEPFRPEFLAGFQTERYTVGLKEGFGAAQGIMEPTIRSLCCRDIGGDHQRLHSVQTQHTAITFKHVLQPVWLAPYRYHDKLYRIAINARTGEVVGTRPYSFWKIAFVILAVLAIIGIIALISGIAQSRHGGYGPAVNPRPTLPAEAPLPQTLRSHRVSRALCRGGRQASTSVDARSVGFAPLFRPLSHSV
jgi:predicted RNA-binding Zn-ribbon protein involved in translation (DUF1610 family)